MNTMQEKTFYQLAGSSMDSTPTSELFKLANEHPYFAAAQYFLACKLQKESHSGFLPHLQKTALYFNNPYWLHYQLLNTPADDIKILHKDYQPEETKPLLNNVIKEEIEQQQLEAIKHSEAVNEFLEETRKQAPVVNLFPIEPKEETVEPTPIQIPTIEAVREMMGSIQNDNVEATVLPREIDEQEIVDEKEPEQVQSVTSFALEAVEEDTYATVQQENIEAAIIPEPIETVSLVEEPVEEIKEGAMANVEETALPSTINEAAMTEETTAPTQVEEQPIEAIETNEQEQALTPDKLTSILSQQLEAFRKPIAEDAKLDIETEPYHTVDYFASQGIKIGSDIGSQDKLSRQLLKFTDWLKHMKHVEVDPQDLGTDPELESAIHNIANTSNEAREIVTETMAEVLEKQGKVDKAIQLYIKLSFLNPDKSTYFATKIQKLKGISS